MGARTAVGACSPFWITTTACGFSVAIAASARGFTKGMTFGGGVVPFAVRAFAVMDGIASRWRA